MQPIETGFKSIQFRQWFKILTHFLVAMFHLLLILVFLALWFAVVYQFLMFFTEFNFNLITMSCPESLAKFTVGGVAFTPSTPLSPKIYCRKK